MKLRRHYMALRRTFPGAKEQEPLEVTTQQLAEALDCTPRNMVNLLKRMCEEGWIGWTPKRGRGNRSQLVFLVPGEQAALQEAQELVRRQDLQSALSLLQDALPASQEQFRQWLTGQFGFRSEIKDRRRLDLLRFPLPQTIATLDPAAIHYIGESHIVNQLFDSLVRMDAASGKVVPHLAHAWETSEDRQTWTFYLRKGVMFHHGRELTSGDVAYSLRRLRSLAPNGLFNWVYREIEEMETPDDTTIRIRLKARNELFLSFLTTNRASILPEDACEAAGDGFGSRPVGSGPFRLAGSEQGIWVLEAYQTYFLGRAFLDKVEIWTMPSGAPDAGPGEEDKWSNFQVMHNVRSSELGGGEWRQIRQSGNTCKFATVNELKDGPLANPAFRAVVDRAISRQKLLKQLHGDDGEPIAGFWPPRNGKGGEPPVTGDAPGRKKLKKMLLESGYGGESVVIATIRQYARDAELIAEQLKRLDIPTEIRLLTAEQFKGPARMEADLLLFAVLLDEHRELRLIDLYKSMQQHMPAELASGMEKLLGRIATEPDAKARSKLFVRTEELLTGRHSLLFLYRRGLKTVFHPSVRGISLESLGWVRFRDLWFKPDEGRP